MKTNKLVFILSLLTVMSFTLTGCEAIASIFKAGMWFGVIGVILVVVLIFWLIGKARK